MKTTNYDIIGNLSPLNRDAAAVRDGSGDQWEARRGQETRWEAPPLLKRADEMLTGGSDELRQWVGRKIGRLTIMGIAAEHKYKANAMWVCRCVCGYYEGRKLARLKVADPERACCSACGDLDHLRWLGGQKNTGASRAAETSRLDALAQRERA